MMAERGSSLAHTAIMRWVQSFAPEFERGIKARIGPMLGFKKFMRARITIAGIELPTVFAKTNST